MLFICNYEFVINSVYNSFLISAPCPPGGWIARDRFCYLASPEEKTYDEANTKCAQLGVDSTLTTITSFDEQKFHTGKKCVF